MIRNPWNSPLINTLQTDDAGRLQQIFMSLSSELIEMRKEIDKLKSMVSSMERRDYGV
jgi:hypothetical protein